MSYISKTSALKDIKILVFSTQHQKTHCTNTLVPEQSGQHFADDKCIDVKEKFAFWLEFQWGKC